MSAVLKGVKVLELGSFITGPCAGMMLADLGAEVIKVEQPKAGDPFRSFQGSLYSPQFRAYNASKRSLTLDLKAARGLDILLRLARSSDVLIDNFRPGVAEELGFGWQRLHEENPRLIHCSITGFGAEGPYASQPCYDTVAQALSGYLSQFVDKEDPRVAGPAVADAITGMYAAYGVLGALFERSRTGVGRRVEVAMLDAMISFSTEPFSGFFATGNAPGPMTRARGSQSYAFECADGKLIALHLSSPEKFWRNLVTALERPALATDARFATRVDRVNNFTALNAELRGLFKARTREEWVERLRASDVPHAPIATVDEVPQHPQVKRRQIFESLRHPTQGAVEHVRRAVLIDGSRDECVLPPPTLGEHTDAILAELGLAGTEIEAMRRDGVV